MPRFLLDRSINRIKISISYLKKVFWPNPPEADKSLCLPCEMPAQLNPYLTFNRGAAYFSGVGSSFQSIGRLKFASSWISALP